MFRIIICDIGGILSQDPWETIYATDPVFQKIFYHYQLTAEKIGQKLFEIVGYTFKNGKFWTEEEYWTLFQEMVKKEFRYLPKEFSMEYLITVSKNINYKTKNFHSIMRLLTELLINGTKPVIFSNNTEFWFRRQFDVLELGNIFSEKESILSQRIGMNKIEIFKNPDLLKKYLLDPFDCRVDQILYFDDRSKNIAAANSIGINAIQII